MSETYMTLCDRCEERMNAEKHPENKYFLEEILGSRRTTRCMICDQIAGCTQYIAESKAMRAMRREIARKKKEAGKPEPKDHRARYRGPWRDT